MRTTILLSLAGLTAACSPVYLEYQSTLQEPTRGVALVDRGVDNTHGQVGMMSTTCLVDPATAALGLDKDYPGDDEVVVDGDENGGNDDVIVVSYQGVHLQSSDGWFEAGEDTVALVDVRDAQLHDRGAVVLHGTGADCAVDWAFNPDELSVPLPADACGTAVDLAVEADGTAAYVGSAAGVFSVDAGGATAIDEAPGDLVAWDPAAEVLYVAQTGGDELRAVEADGTQRWSLALDGAVTELHDMGDRGWAAVVIARADDSRALVFADGETGLVVDTKEIGSGAIGVSTSSGGRAVAVIEASKVRFYNVWKW